MSFKPVEIFGFIMSFTYVFFGLLIIMTPFAVTFIPDDATRKIAGGAFMAYGLFRVTFFLRRLIKKK